MIALLLVILVPIGAIAFFLRFLRIKNLGHLPISTSSVAYDDASFGHRFNWDKNCFYINSKPVWIHSGEFHYWRLPDKTRWKSVLLQYKAAGLNCVRIYFSWSFHSPDQGVYHFDDNRDVDFLLTLCEDLELFVLAAPGPYICAETQGGGHPAWLVAKREIRLRHSVTTMFRSYDENYSSYCLEWFGAILPLIARHQITSKLKGCVLALQIENEAFETIKGFPIGLSDDMRVLSKAARDLGITVPLFTNDAWEEGSFVARPDNHTIGGVSTFGLDLYGFDKYVVFCPTSNPFTIPSETTKNKSTWSEWNPKDVINAFSATETTVRGFGGGASSSPIFIPELQGGWFNHYTVGCTFDDVYTFYGENFTKMVTETALSQGCTAFNIYMAYGGTNWGTLGDPDVYTSYDYSACIREYGHLSGRARKLRLALSFSRSFATELLKTECNDDSVRSSFTIHSSTSKFISKQRRSLGPNPIYFVFFRNFNELKISSSTITVSRFHREPIQLTCKLGYKDSFIGVANYKTANGLHLIISTLPICVKTKTASGNEVWIVQSDHERNGQLAFQGGLDVEGSLDPVTQRQDDVSIVSFKAHSGWCKIQNKIDKSSSALFIIALTGNDLYSLTPIFRDEYWGGEENGRDANSPIAVFWGLYQINYDVAAKNLHVFFNNAARKISCIAPFVSFPGFSPLKEGPDFIQERLVDLPVDSVPHVAPSLSFQQTRQLDLASLPWIPLDLVPKGTYPRKNAIDFCYLSGHVAYKLVFTLSSSPGQGLWLDVNVRHRCSIIINNKSIGGHLTYSLSSLKPGAKQGPDAGRYVGWKKYMLPSTELKVGDVNEVYVLVESLGLNRSPGPVDDIRSPRGLLDARIRGIAGSLGWFIAGVDVRTLSQAFNHSGFPDDPNSDSTFTNGAPLSSIPKGIVLPTWFKACFAANDISHATIAPLRLCLSGDNLAYIYLNDVLIGRYCKEGPQRDFFLPPGLLSASNTLTILTYGTSGPDSDLSLALKYWRIAASDESMISGSGNIDDGEEGRDFILHKLSL